MRAPVVLCVLALAAAGGCGLKPAPRENPAIVTSTLPDATVGRAYALQLEVKKGSPPFTWSLADVPDALQWLTVDPATGALGGTPNALVTPGATFTVTVTDVIHRSDSKALTLAVTNAPVIVTDALPDAVINASYSTVVTAEGGTPPLTWSLRDLPPALQWLAIDPASGTLGGTPTAAVNPGATFTIAVAGADQLEGSKDFTLLVKGPPTIITTSLPDAFVHSAYSAVVEAEGGMPPFAWSLRDLPDALQWLTIDPSTGALGGRPTAVVEPGATFTVVASDANHLEGRQALTLAARDCMEGEQIGCWALGGTGDQCMAGMQTCARGTMGDCAPGESPSTSLDRCGPGQGGGACGTCDRTRADACISGRCRCGGGPACAIGSGSCTDGECRCAWAPACTNGLTCCPDDSGVICIDTQNDFWHCGSCSRCSSDTADNCANGQCRCGTGAECTNGTTCCLGSCVSGQCS